MKHFISKIAILVLLISVAFSAPIKAASPAAPWTYSASKFAPLWLVKSYPIPSAGSWVSPQSYIGDDCIPWQTSMTDYWSNYINWTNQRCYVISVFAACSGPGYTRYKAYISHTPIGGTTQYAYWDAEFLPLY